MSDKLSISQQNEIMNIPDYEAGIYSSFYEGEGISFEDEELGFEKVDNTLDSARRKKIPLSQTKCEFNVYHNTKDNIKTSYYFDNTGMNSDDCKKYKNFMNSNETIGREKNNIGKHGMGSKFNDYQHSKKGSTVVFSKYEKDYSLLYFNYKQMSIDLKKKNLANLLTRNSSTKTFKNLEEMLEFIEELYKDKDKLYSYNSCIDKNDLKNLINIKLKNNGTVFLYNTEDNTNNINNIYNQKKFKDKCNIIYTDYLNEGFEIKINFKNELINIEANDILHIKELRTKYPSFIGYNTHKNNKKIELFIEYDINIYYNGEQYQAEVILNSQRILFFKYNSQSGQTDELKCNKDYNLTMSINLKMVLLPNNINYDTNEGGVYLKSDNRIMGNAWFPKGLRKNENSLLRSVLKYDNYFPNALIQPGINKSTRKIHPFINYILENILSTKRSELPVHKKDFNIINTNEFNKAEELKANEEAELKAKKEAELKANEEAELKSKEEAELKANEEAELKSKEEAELKSNEEAELKSKEEAELKANEEVEQNDTKSEVNSTENINNSQTLQSTFSDDQCSEIENHIIDRQTDSDIEQEEDKSPSSISLKGYDTEYNIQYSSEESIDNFENTVITHDLNTQTTNEAVNSLKNNNVEKDIEIKIIYNGPKTDTKLDKKNILITLNNASELLVDSGEFTELWREKLIELRGLFAKYRDYGAINKNEMRLIKNLDFIEIINNIKYLYEENYIKDDNRAVKLGAEINRLYEECKSTIDNCN